MSEQAYFGTCPAGDPGGLRLSLLLSDPSGQVRYPPTMRVGCPRESELGEALAGGELCPDGGMHDLRAITPEELTVLEAGPPPMVRWARSPSDGIWHAVPLCETSYTCPECEMTSDHPRDAEHGYCGACHAFQGVTAACGHRLPTAALAERTPGYPACLGCVARHTTGLIGSGWSI